MRDWWNKNNAGKSTKKGVVENYGKNYFQSFVLDNYSSFIDNDDELASILRNSKNFWNLRIPITMNLKKMTCMKKTTGLFLKNTVEATSENNISDTDEQRKYEEKLYVLFYQQLINKEFIIELKS